MVNFISDLMYALATLINILKMDIIQVARNTYISMFDIIIFSMIIGLVVRLYTSYGKSNKRYVRNHREERSLKNAGN